VEAKIARKPIAGIGRKARMLERVTAKRLAKAQIIKRMLAPVTPTIRRTLVKAIKTFMKSLAHPFRNE
jgi:hypothetical protein